MHVHFMHFSSLFEVSMGYSLTNATWSDTDSMVRLASGTDSDTDSMVRLATGTDTDTDSMVR